MGRPKKEDTLIEKVLKGEEVDFSTYSHNQITECVRELAKKVNEKKGTLLSESDLKSIKSALNSQIIKIDKAINPINVVEPIAPIEPTKPKDKKADKKKKEEAKDTTTEEKKDVNTEEEEAKDSENAPTVKVAEPTAIAEEEKE